MEAPLFNRKRRPWKSLRLNGPGRTRIKLAEMFKEQHGIDISPYDIHQNNFPAAKYLDLCRWCFDGKDADGHHVHVCSWDRMTDIVKSGIIAVVDDDPHHFEVCSGTPVKDDLTPIPKSV